MQSSSLPWIFFLYNYFLDLARSVFSKNFYSSHEMNSTEGNGLRCRVLNSSSIEGNGALSRSRRVSGSMNLSRPLIKNTRDARGANL